MFSLFDKSLHDGRTYLGIQRRYDSPSGVGLLGHHLHATAAAVEATVTSIVNRRLF